MKRISSIHLQLGFFILTIVVLLISLTAILNYILYESISEEFWFFLIVFLWFLIPLISLYRMPIVYCSNEILWIKYNYKKDEKIPLKDIDKVYQERDFFGRINFRQVEIAFKEKAKRRKIKFISGIGDLEDFLFLLEDM